MIKKYLSIFILILAALASGCAASLPYAKVEGALSSGRADLAKEALDGAKGAYFPNSRLLYYFDQSWAAHLGARFEESSQWSEQANQLIDELYTTSLSKQALTFLSNDMAAPYEGENFERVMSHSVACLNYAVQGKRDAALVEARRADQRLRQYAEKAGPDKVTYKEDALSRYLAACLYESEGGQSRWDAYLDYKKALEAYELYQRAYRTPRPRQLELDLLRLSRDLGEKTEHEDFKKRFGEQPLPDLKGKGELILVLHEGLAPVKETERVDLPLHLNDGTLQYFSTSFPRFVPRGGPRAEARATVDGVQERDFELFQDVEAIALRDLKERVGLITVKTIARATAKFQAARALQAEARRQGGDGAALLAMLGTNLYGIISEQADIRSWRTLPARVSICRLALAPGKRQVSVRVDYHGRVTDKVFADLEVKAGEKKFLDLAVY